jgi:proteic killer suppression protein
VRKFRAIERSALRKLDMLDAAPDIRTLSTLPGNRLERLKGDRKGQYSIRINDQWRICFEWRDGHAYEVEIVDYHVQVPIVIKVSETKAVANSNIVESPPRAHILKCQITPVAKCCVGSELRRSFFPQLQFLQNS